MALFTRGVSLLSSIAQRLEQPAGAPSASAPSASARTHQMTLSSALSSRTDSGPTGSYVSRKRAVPLHVLALIVSLVCAPVVVAATDGAAADGHVAHHDRRLISSAGRTRDSTVSTMAAGGRNAEALLRAAIAAANAQSKTITVHLTSNVYLTKPLPSLGFNAGLAIRGNCNGGKCVIDARRQFPMFAGGFNCYLVLEQLTVKNALNGVHTGGCAVTARHVSFISNVARTTGGGAVINSRNASPTAGSPLQFTFCEFINNTAVRGDGGVFNVGRQPVGGPVLRLAGCLFRANRAAKGKGGAIYSEDNEIYMNSCKFERNYAYVGGGAIATSARRLTSIKSTFFKNEAVQAPQGMGLKSANRGGGAVLVASKDSVLSFCSTTWAGNLNRMREAAGDISMRLVESGGAAAAQSADGADSSGSVIASTSAIGTGISSSSGIRSGTSSSGGGSISFCGTPAPANVDRAPGMRLLRSCSGCTGCPSDCNGHGKCVFDADLTPRCQCAARYDNATACFGCAQGYTRLSGCRACAPGFMKRANGACSACRALDYVPALQSNLGGITGMIPLASYAQCQKQCLATQVQQNNYCNLWAYIDASPANGECGGKCIMFHDADDCGVGKVVSVPQLGVWYQYSEPSFTACH